MTSSLYQGSCFFISDGSRFPSQNLNLTIFGAFLNLDFVSSWRDSHTLFLYLAISNYTISGVLIQEDEWVQKLIYYINKSLVQAETHYIVIEKLVLVLTTLARNLRLYFQCHPIMVVTTFSLKTILQ